MIWAGVYLRDVIFNFIPDISGFQCDLTRCSQSDSQSLSIWCVVFNQESLANVVHRQNHQSRAFTAQFALGVNIYGAIIYPPGKKRGAFSQARTYCLCERNLQSHSFLLRFILYRKTRTASEIIPYILTGVKHSVLTRKEAPFFQTCPSCRSSTDSCFPLPRLLRFLVNGEVFHALINFFAVSRVAICCWHLSNIDSRVPAIFSLECVETDLLITRSTFRQYFSVDVGRTVTTDFANT